ncbi:MAG: formyltransferase family protein [Candidatus Diapherotrites archaeon]|nr:formyltransferase family protein [Candidatus Diapherotrites archaeon]
MFGFFSPKPLFEQKNRPLKLAVLFSGNAGSANFILEEMKKRPELKQKIKFVGAFSDNSMARGAHSLKNYSLEIVIVDRDKFFIIHSLDSKSQDARKKYFERALQEIKEMNAEFLMLSGFMRIVGEPLLSEFSFRMLNVHPSNLTIVSEGKPAFTGKNAVLDALTAGQTELRSTIHFITGEVDCGPVLVLSKAVKVDMEKLNAVKDDRAKLQEYADSMQEKLKREGDDPAFLKALELVADSLVAIKNSKVFIKENGKWKQGYFDLESGAVKI